MNLIERAAKAMLDESHGEGTWEMREPAEEALYLRRATVALAVFEEALAPTGDDREAQGWREAELYASGDRDAQDDFMTGWRTADRLRPEVPEPSAENMRQMRYDDGSWSRTLEGPIRSRDEQDAETMNAMAHHLRRIADPEPQGEPSSEIPEPSVSKPPAYLAADLWGALGAPTSEFDAYYDRNGWAETWSNLLGAVRDHFKPKCGLDVEGEPCVLSAGHLPPHYGASDVGSSEPVPVAETQGEPFDRNEAARRWAARTPIGPESAPVQAFEAGWDARGGVQGEPSDAEVLAALNTRARVEHEASGTRRPFQPAPALTIEYFSGPQVRAMRAALRAAAAVRGTGGEQ